MTSMAKIRGAGVSALLGLINLKHDIDFQRDIININIGKNQY